MRIKKIYLKNFKGVNHKKVIKIDSGATLLIGPNGFGKTTIFDVLELCITGKMYRTETKKNVTSDNKDYKKPFYQNNKDQDVIVKVWLEKTNRETDENENLIIVRYLDKDSDGRSSSRGKRNKPCDFAILKAFKDSPETFADDEFDSVNANVLTAEEISEFLGLDPQRQCIDDLYHLFNYLQQEETTFFMKKKEKDRKSALGFLLQTSYQEEQLKLITEKHSKYSKIKGKLENKIIEEKGTLLADCPEYEKLFQDKNIPFDNKDIFTSETYMEKEEQRKQYLMSLDKLTQFCGTFDFAEYKKRKKAESLNKLLDEDFMKYFVLSDIITGSNFEELKFIFLFINDGAKLKKIILQKLIKQIEDFSDVNERIERYDRITKLKTFDKLLQEMDKYYTDYEPELSVAFKEVLKHRKTIIDAVNGTDEIVKEVIRLRKELLISFKDSESNNTDKTNCPFCGLPWTSVKKLLEGYDSQEEKYNKIIGDQAQKLLDLEQSIKKDYIEPVIKQMKIYLKTMKSVDQELMDLLNELKEVRITEEIGKYIEIKDFIWEEPKEMIELEKSLDSLKRALINNTNVTQYVYDDLIRLKNVDFSEQESLITEQESEALKHLVIPKNNEISLTENILQQYVSDVRNTVTQLIQGIKYDNIKAGDVNGCFNAYFDSNSELYDSFDPKALTRKREYINGMFSIIKSDVVGTFQTRLEKLDTIVKNLEVLRRIYSETISNYKMDMTERIKLPFYIYSAKILQNYQQGMGVFLATNENNDSIRFLTDPTTDHDAMHHLSSGQLSVTSLAFTLAINKTYSISDELKFLLIDDPIQEMDSLNIHSFIELIRHEFVDDYQLIFSTHSDMNALYIKYKLEKLKNRPVELINVQTEFFY